MTKIKISDSRRSYKIALAGFFIAFAIVMFFLFSLNVEFDFILNTFATFSILIGFLAVLILDDKEKLIEILVKPDLMTLVYENRHTTRSVDIDYCNVDKFLFTLTQTRGAKNCIIYEGRITIYTKNEKPINICTESGYSLDLIFQFLKCSDIIPNFSYELKNVSKSTKASIEYFEKNYKYLSLPDVLYLKICDCFEDSFLTPAKEFKNDLEKLQDNETLKNLQEDYKSIDFNFKKQDLKLPDIKNFIDTESDLPLYKRIFSKNTPIWTKVIIILILASMYMMLLYFAALL